MGQAVTPLPISVTCCEWNIIEAPFVLWAQPLDSSHYVAGGLPNKITSQSFGALCLCLSASAVVHPLHFSLFCLSPFLKVSSTSLKILYSGAEGEFKYDVFGIL
jgi:hypothetical protein